MVYTEQYNRFEAGFLKEAADQGMDIPYLKGMIAEASEIQEKWAAAYDEVEQITGDKLFRIKLGNDFAQYILTKHADPTAAVAAPVDPAAVPAAVPGAEPTGEAPSWYDPTHPQMQSLLKMFGGGGKGGAIGGGMTGGLLGLVLGLMTKNPMLGLMLGGLGGAGFGGLLGSGKFKEWFGKNSPAATSLQEGNGSPASDPSQLPKNHADGESSILAQHQGEGNLAGNQAAQNHHDPEAAALSQLAEGPNTSSSPAEAIKKQLAGIEGEAAGGPASDPRAQSTLHNDPEAAALDEQFATAGQPPGAPNPQPQTGSIHPTATNFAPLSATAPSPASPQPRDGNFDLKNLGSASSVSGWNNFNQVATDTFPGTGGDDASNAALFREQFPYAADEIMKTNPKGFQARANEGAIAHRVSQMPSAHNTPMFPKGPPASSASQQAPMRSLPNNNNVQFKNTPTPNVSAPSIKALNVPTQNVPATRPMGKTGHLKLSSLLSPPHTPGQMQQPSILDMGQPTTKQQAPLLPKGAPVVYPNSGQPRQMTSNYAIAPKA